MDHQRLDGRGFWENAPAPPPAAPGPPPVLPSYRVDPSPAEPPARVGGAVAALLAALASLIVPVLTVWGGMPMLAWLVNAPGIVFGILAVSRLRDPREVERFIRYTWACTFVYTGLLLMIVVGLVALLALLLA